MYNKIFLENGWNSVKVSSTVDIFDRDSKMTDQKIDECLCPANNSQIWQQNLSEKIF